MTLLISETLLLSDSLLISETLLLSDSLLHSDSLLLSDSLPHTIIWDLKVIGTTFFTFLKMLLHVSM